LALFVSRDKLDAERFDVVPNNEGPPCGSGTYASNAAYYGSQGIAGNKYSGGTLSSRQRLAGSPLRLVSGGDPVSTRFGDQLIAVLPRLRRFARGLSGSVADADDLVQAACERALARQHQFQEGTRFDSWMFRIVQTIWIDQVRSRDVRKEDGDVAEDRLGSDEPVRRVEARLALAEVRRALDRLPPDQRTALLLVTVEGLSYKEAAEVVQVPIGTIMSRLARARIALQLQLEAGREGRRSTNDAAAQ
jgi:RNA polymerase sigma-70 factor, ECF subfamily